VWKFKQLFSQQISMRNIIHLASCTLLFLSGCQSTQRDNIEVAIRNNIKKFPQLPAANGDLTSSYPLIRSVYIGPIDIELQLRMVRDSMNGENKIIVAWDKKYGVCIIPLFSNHYRDYWNFQYDHPKPGIIPVNSTFESELQESIRFFHLNDSTDHRLRYRGTFITELMYSLLQCRDVEPEDSARLMRTPVEDFYQENMDSCSLRLQSGWKAIRKELTPGDTNIIPEFFSYYDKTNQRIYQVNQSVFRKDSQINHAVKNYRLGSETILITCGSQ
jgi:hypothetical protein